MPDKGGGWFKFSISYTIGVSRMERAGNKNLLSFFLPQLVFGKLWYLQYCRKVVIVLSVVELIIKVLVYWGHIVKCN